MPPEFLSPKLTELAARLGREAAAAVAAGETPEPCPWRTDEGSITRARLAGVWSRAFAEQAGPIPDLPAD